jgi:hypothetical protein
LPLRELRAEQRAKEIFVEGNGAVDELLPLNRAIALEPLKPKVEQVQAGPVVNVIGVNEHEPIRKGRDLRKPQIVRIRSPWLSMTTRLPLPSESFARSRRIRLCSNCVLPCPDPPSTCMCSKRADNGIAKGRGVWKKGTRGVPARYSVTGFSSPTCRK